MKKWIMVLVTLVCVMSLIGCQKTKSGSEVYAFPEPTAQIEVSFYSQGAVSDIVIGSEEYNPEDLSVVEVIEWFYGLELSPCEKPEDVEGGESYGFYVSDELVFSYQDRGSEAYIIISGTWYKVKNPSVPPIKV